MRGHARLGAAFLAAFGFGCASRTTEAPSARGAFGVFFGGEVQELVEVEVPALRPASLGFRLTFAAQGADEHRVHYEVVRPGPRGRRITSLDDFVVSGQETAYDRLIPIPPDAELGTWNVRVECDGVAVIDRAVFLRRVR